VGESQAVLVIDETGFLKKGQHSAGVARHYSGPAGRIEHCHMGVLLAYASRQGQALLDGARYLPPGWTNDRERCERVGLPEPHPCATKPQWARQLLERAFDAKVPAAWVTGASVYGDDRRRVGVAERAQAYVLAVSGQAYVWRGGSQPQGKTV
jgi:SRSO17 transposase